MVSETTGIAYAEVIVYVPIFVLTAIVIFRQGMEKQLGWIYLGIFCIVRLAGAGFKIAENKSPNNATDIEWASILQSVGLSPLLMASLGLLERITDECSNHARSENNSYGPGSGMIGLVSKRATANFSRSRIIQIAQLPTTIALVLCVVGGIDESHSSTSDMSTGKKYTKIGVIIFIFVYLLLSALTVITMKDVGNAPRGEKRIYVAVICALPLLAVRLLWSVLATFVHNSDFSLTSPEPFIQLFMAIIEEIIIVCFYVLVGLAAPRPGDY